MYSSLPEAVRQGLITEEEIDESLARLLRIRFRLGNFDPEETDIYSSIPYSVLESAPHKAHALEMAEKSMVLLKNNGILPLGENMTKIAVLGVNADSPEVQLGNYNGFPSEIITPLEGISGRTDAGISYLKASDYTTGMESEGKIMETIRDADIVIYIGGISPRLEGEEGDAGKEKLEGFLGGDRTSIMLPDFSDYSMSGRTYRYFKGKPLYPFGFGLSYTTFEYDTPVCVTESPKTGGTVRIASTVRNTGDRTGDEVVQLYISHPDAPEPKPIRALKGIKRVTLAPGEEQTVYFELDGRDLSLVDAEGNSVCSPGRVSVYVGGAQPETDDDTERQSAIIRIKGGPVVLAK